MKRHSMATSKHKILKLSLNPANQKVVDFLDTLQRLSENHFENTASSFLNLS